MTERLFRIPSGRATISAAPGCRQARIRRPASGAASQATGHGHGDRADCARRWPQHGSVPVRRAGAKSFADDLGLSRGIIRSRAVPSLRSPEIHPPTLAFVPPGRDPVPSTAQGSRLDLENLCPKNLARLPGAPSGTASWHRTGSTGEHAQVLNSPQKMH